MGIMMAFIGMSGAELRAMVIRRITLTTCIPCIVMHCVEVSLRTPEDSIQAVALISSFAACSRASI